jgi:hypothetical protein
MASKKDIKYINRDFPSLKDSLISYAKTYFPNTYSDFTPSSPGMMFMEMAAYVGDVLSFYVDNQVQETFIQYARQTQNLYELAYLLGYKPRVTSAATVVFDIYQQVPATISASVAIPDYTYALQIPENTTVTSNLTSSLKFLIQDNVDFTVSSSLDPTEVTVYSTANNAPTYYLLKKQRQAISATIKTQTNSFTVPVAFNSFNINDTNIIGISSITDSNNNIWYEVDNLAQDSIFESIKNTNINNPNFSSDTNVANLLQVKQIARRFATRFLNKTTLQIQFGAGSPTDTTEVIIPNPNNVGIGLPTQKSKLTTAYSPTNFIFTNTYGIAPANTILTTRYLVGGGVSANAQANSLTLIDTTNVKFLNSSITNSSLANQIFTSLLVTNPVAADGGSDGDNINEIRQNSLGNFQNQLRTVTFDDYVIRALSLPSNYGNIAKVFAAQQKASDVATGDIPSVLDLYVLAYNVNQQLIQASAALKQNLSVYLSEYRIINDNINIKDAYIINIGVNIDIITLPNYNNDEVLLKCITAMRDYFNIENWQINQPIILRDINVILDRIEGVQTVKNVSIVNKVGASNGYSDFAYDISAATNNSVIYPSLDPMIFEVKYPNTDIQAKVVPF